MHVDSVVVSSRSICRYCINYFIPYSLNFFPSSLWDISIRLGYCLAMIPILIKLSAINKLNRAGYEFQRVANIDSGRFKRVMSITMTLLISYLVLWTIMDKAELEREYIGRDVDGVKIVYMYDSCSSRSNWWEIMAFAFEVLLLLATTILTYQSSDVIDELNER